MPVLVPVVSLSPSPPNHATATVQIKSKGNAVKVPKRRQYDERPLPVAPSGLAPRTAEIVGRTDPLNEQNLIEPKYTVRLGSVEIGDIGINEILDYVSALELEEFENSRFEVEAEVHEANRLAREDVERRKAEERKLKVGRPKGVAGYRVPGDNVADGGQDNSGREGRSRPTYKHLFKQLKQRRRRKRDLVTGELMPLSDEEMEEVEVEDSSADEEPQKSVAQRELVPGLQPAKRRRRKRDPVTGELLPLPPLAGHIVRPMLAGSATDERGMQAVGLPNNKHKRPRRRRHPQTGELMPLGWTYDPNRDDTTASFGVQSSRMQTMPAMKDLTLAQGPERKRRRMTSESASQKSASPMVGISLARLDSSAQINAPDLESSEEELVSDKRLAAFNPRVAKKEVIEISESATDHDGEVNVDVRPHPTPRLSKTSILNPTAATDTEHYNRTTSTSVSSDELIEMGPSQKTTLTSPAHDARSKATTSIMYPTAHASESEPELDDGDDDLSEGEYRIERILAHHLSDPKTHPADLGKDPVMLYKVKWEGWDQPTWEPASSFADPDTVAEYHRSLKGSDKS